MTQALLDQLLAIARNHPPLAGRVGRDDAGNVTAQYAGATFATRFSPVLDFGSFASASSAPSSAGRFGDDIGVEAKLVALTPDLRHLGPRELFGTIDDDQQLVELDRLSRTLHVLNFFGRERHGMLFLNVHERLLKSVRYDHGRQFSTIVKSFGLLPTRIVIEIPEPAAAHKTFLNNLTRSYRSHGFRVAANLPGAGHILTMNEIEKPDFIKIDAGIAIRDSIVKPLAGYANRLGVPLIFKRIDTDQQLRTLQQYGVCYGQGAFIDALYDDTTGELRATDAMARTPGAA
jgi:EAL domain-containing protein (putative c-di-GMP-specific phosphodiesterase class I)